MKTKAAVQPITLESVAQSQLLARRIGQTELASAIGKTPQFANKILRRGLLPTLEVQTAIEAAFGIERADWLRRPEPGAPTSPPPGLVYAWRSQGAAALFLACHPDDELFKAPRLWSTTPEAVADACGVEPGVVTAWVLGRTEPGPAAARSLEGHCYLPAEWWGEPGPEGEAALSTLALCMGLRAPTPKEAAYFEREHGIKREAWKQPAHTPRHTGVPL